MTKPNVLRVTTIDVPPWHVWKYDDSGKLVVEGLISFLINSTIVVLQRKYNFTDVEITVAGLNQIGYEASPGNWTSSIGMLSRKEADIFGGQYFVMPELYPYVDYATSFDGTDFSILSGPPSKLHTQVPSLFSSVDFDTWVCLGISWIIVSLLYNKLSKIERSMYENIEKGSLIQYLLTFYGLLFQRGFDNLPWTLSRRILVTGWLMLVLVLTIELSGALSSKLAVQDVPERIDKIQDILKYPDVTPLIAQGTGTDTFLSLSTDSQVQSVWRQTLRREGIVKYDEFFTSKVFSPIRQGKGVALGSINAHFLGPVNAACQEKVSNFYIAKEAFLSTPWAGMIRKDLPVEFVETLNRFYTLYGGMGFPLDLWKKMGKHAGPCFAIDTSLISHSPTTVNGMIGVFKVLAMGLATSTGVLVLETLTKPFPRLLALFDED